MRWQSEKIICNVAPVTVTTKVSQRMKNTYLYGKDIMLRREKGKKIIYFIKCLLCIFFCTLKLSFVAQCGII